MPTQARPEVDLLEGLTTAIIVDQERMGANPRSTVGTATDANAMLRIVFSRLGDPHIGSPQAYSFNTPSVAASGAITVDRGEGKTKRVKASFNRTGGMCPRCEGMGSVTDFDLTALYDDSKSLNEGALTIPGYSVDGWYGRIFSGCGFFDPDKPIRKFTKRELQDLLYKEPTKIKVDNINLTYEGLIPKIQSQCCRRTARQCSPIFGPSSTGQLRSQLVLNVTAPGSLRARGFRRSMARTSLMRAPCRSAIWRSGCADSTNRRWHHYSKHCSRRWSHSLRLAWVTCRLIDPQERCRVARRNARN